MDVLDLASAAFVPCSAWAMQRGVRRSLLATLAGMHHPWSCRERPQRRDRARIVVQLEQT